jgi:hypothetical protein
VEFLSGGDTKPFQAFRECGYTPSKPVLSKNASIALRADGGACAFDFFGKGYQMGIKFR